jgi:hypothetical protein
MDLLQNINIWNKRKETLQSIIKTIIHKIPERWLILGAGESRDYEKWDLYVRDKNANWQGLNNNCDPHPECYNLDFNSSADLHKLPVDHFDKIFFDQGTAWYSKWNLRHILALYTSLKLNGELYIPSTQTPPVQSLFPKEDKNVIKKGIIDKLENAKNNEIFVNGTNGVSLSFLEEKDRKDILEKIYSQNLDLLHAIIYPFYNFQLRLNADDYPTYLKRDDAHYIRDYYYIVKSDREIIGKNNSVIDYLNPSSQQ